jgi:hypothetical protein
MNFDEFKELYPSPEISSFLVSERIDRDKIVLKKIYIDMAEDLVAGIVLNQIVFWHCPNDNGEIKLTVVRDGHLWLRKKREDWWKECRVTTAQFDKACKRLEDLDLIVVKKYKWNGSPVKHIRVDWAVFLAVLERAKANYGKKEGYRHRPPTKTSGANRYKADTASISTNSENQVNFANSENPTSLLAKNRELRYQGKSNFPNSENDLYNNETFNETTRETVSPPIRQAEESPDSKQNSLAPEKPQPELAPENLKQGSDLVIPPQCDNTPFVHPVTKSDEWLKGGYKMPEWAIKRVGQKWIARQELVNWYAEREKQSKAFARDYLQKIGEEDRTNDVWSEYKATKAVRQMVEAPKPIAGTESITSDQVKGLLAKIKGVSK